MEISTKTVDNLASHPVSVVLVAYWQKRAIGWVLRNRVSFRKKSPSQKIKVRNSVSRVVWISPVYLICLNHLPES
ncbi:hypothetical protein [Planktothricoides raciborskii]|uniref:Uncharacterized protein n=1 Tax=Planktothricoides raciborskii FACHB-1370 TaxID=2949576 RepID=A0ABR8EGB8_9CYAN|nr:hypothetical protein [Planktothricoides raciborskii]MBD2545144.1 hypothetical protein [Planktothricoides raciborskii FACHB-1370]MBD2585598.1 hypothetical protein [Planktothricoides raciborskii FACHB-1261]